jgi:NAD(P)-dependent dehydrogenase (short-subunit alcohol dehydrogenase family)
MGRLDGKVAVLTGTGRGQARDVALRFAAEGARIVGGDIDGEAAQETLELVREAGGEMESLHPIDLSEEESAHRFVEFAADAYDGFDVLYNNAMRLHFGYPEDYPLEDWEFTIRNTLTLPFLVSKHAIPHFRKRGAGSIIFVSSSAALPYATALPGNDNAIFAYAAAKAGVLRLSVSLAIELGPLNVRVNSLVPGPIASPLSKGVFADAGDPFHDAYAESSLVGRIGTPEDVANAALYLASDEAKYVTGAMVQVDGGTVASGGLGPPDPKLMFKNLLPEFITLEPHWPSAGSRA